MQRRVAITGLGIISASGHNVQDFWAAMREGRSAIKPITSIPPGVLRFSNAGEVTNFDPNKYFAPKEVQFLDPFAQYGVVAARNEIKDSGFEWTPELKAQTAVITGSCMGGKLTEDD